MNELLSCEALTKCYQKDKAALENVDLHIGFGRIEIGRASCRERV